LTAALALFIGLCLLAVDWGRVQVAKTELVRATDAAARAGAVHLPGNPALARSAAAQYAAYNSVDGRPLVLQPADVLIGRWNPATGTFDTASASPDAIRITGVRSAARGNAVPLAFGQAMGIQPKDLNVVVTARGTRGVVGGIVGYNKIDIHNNTFVGSYRSSQTTNPTTGTAGSKGSLGSNGVIDGHRHVDLHGDAYLGPDGSLTDLSVRGSTKRQSAPLAVPAQAAWAPGSNPSGVPQNYTAGGGTTTLPGGTYWFTRLTVNNTLTFSGPAVVYVNGPVDLNGDLRAYNGIPAHLKLYQRGSGGFGVGNNVTLTADIEAPASDLDTHNNFTFRGRMLFRTITLHNNADLYYDEDLGPSDGSSTVSIVQ
jgi:hypothetical protein